MREQMEETGSRILNQTKTELYLSMPFLGVALDSLEFKLDLSTPAVGTDAAYIRFNPTWLLQRYVERPELLGRMYMHMLVHCIFRHMFHAGEHEDGELWDLCCDIAAESVIDSMDYPLLLRVSGDFRQQWYDKLTEELSVLTAEKLYHYFILKKRDPYLEEALRQEFKVCDHCFWERMRPPGDPKGEDKKAAGGEAPREEALPMDRVQESKMGEREKEWKEHAKRIESDLEVYGKEAAADAGRLTWLLRIENRRRRSYKDFLQHFAVLREMASVDLDSFDYGFYMYGLSLYGNMPLVEENEYREERRVEELVIAIDTSASCKGKLVQQFLNETGAVLACKESFFHRVQIRILECDNRLQRDISITELSQMERYAKQFQVSGGYGTDFRPVFSYVEELMARGELKHLKGLLYFTDGLGEYPKKPTPYETAFVFCGDGGDGAPDWVIRLYLTEEGI
ncbi:MAG: VWA-like domain-containing protein [Blautia sp.]|nr:VWA-like domain-containing protein [Blautia sp.]